MIHNKQNLFEPVDFERTFDFTECVQPQCQHGLLLNKKLLFLNVKISSPIMHKSILIYFRVLKRVRVNDPKNP